MVDIHLFSYNRTSLTGPSGVDPPLLPGMQLCVLTAGVTQLRASSAVISQASILSLDENCILQELYSQRLPYSGSFVFKLSGNN